MHRSLVPSSRRIVVVVPRYGLCLLLLVAVLLIMTGSNNSCDVVQAFSITTTMKATTNTPSAVVVVATVVRKTSNLCATTKVAITATPPPAAAATLTTTRRDWWTRTTTTAALVTTFAATTTILWPGPIPLPPPPAYAATMTTTTTVGITDTDRERLRLGYQQIVYLLDNFEQETTTCRDNGGECKRDADNIRRVLGLRSTVDPLFQIEKVFAKIKYDETIDVDLLDDFYTATEDWTSAINMSNSMAFISQFGEYNPGGGKDEVLKYLLESQKQLILARDALKTICTVLNVKV